MRLFRAVQGTALANQVKASWERLGVTNYVFDYTEMCLCSGIRATLTVVSNQVVKVENARNAQGDPVPNPLVYRFTINDLFDTWVSSEPSGGYAQELEFDLNGFAKLIFIDPDPHAADEELIYEIHSLTPLL